MNCGIVIGMTQSMTILHKSFVYEALLQNSVKAESVYTSESLKDILPES